MSERIEFVQSHVHQGCITPDPKLIEVEIKIWSRERFGIVEFDESIGHLWAKLEITVQSRCQSVHFYTLLEQSQQFGRSDSRARLLSSLDQ